MFAKMVSVILIFFTWITICLSCRLIVPSELLNGCIFDPMIVSVSHAGFSVSRENCNTAVAKHIFADQPLVYYGRARSVCVRKKQQNTKLTHLYCETLFNSIALCDILKSKRRRTVFYRMTYSLLIRNNVIRKTCHF